MAWEVKVIDLVCESAWQEKQLNDLGRENWELISVVHYTDQLGKTVAVMAYLKKEVSG